MDKMK
jgi:hypothetical protein